ncbi:hypothetical protein EJ08DRAFT_657631 [Tothia fuscella]|uniref:HMG box domain-containing protein n=1 Tax=Tothia fuscella TaxID=1048955 RepID=A0A9P4U0T3_9PEZI|nr:hypothetical protein EJ08DRAFT_657631 [Tothia fuscella]
MLRCAAVTRVAGAASKTPIHDVSQLTRALHHLAITPSLAQYGFRASLTKSFARTLATEAVQTTVVETKVAKVGRPATKPRAKTAAAKKSTTTKKSTTKAKPKKKVAAKTKAAPKKRKVAAKKVLPKRKVKARSERQKTLAVKKKERDAIKALRETALIEPKRGPDNAWMVFMSEATKEGTGAVTTRVKEAAAKFKAFTPAELEHYNHIAYSNKDTNEAEYRAWINKHTAEQIRLANSARKTLQRRLKVKSPKGGKKFGRGLSPLKDERQIRGPSSAYLKFSTERQKSGDFKHIKLGEASTLISKEWKEASPAEKKAYTDLQAADKARYAREYKATYGHPPPSRTPSKASSTTST